MGSNIIGSKDDDLILLKIVKNNRLISSASTSRFIDGSTARLLHRA